MPFGYESFFNTASNVSRDLIRNSKMLRARDSLRVTLRKTLLIQAVLTGIAAVIALLVKSPSFALHLVYGGAVTSIGTGLHAWRLLKIAMPTDDKDDKIGDPAAEQANALANAGAEAFKGAVLKPDDSLLMPI